MNPPGSAPQLNFALIGCGLVGRKRAIAINRTASLLWACDSDPQRASEVAALAPGAHSASEASAAITDPRVHAVIVATFNDALGRLALAAINAGKHVLIEKPGALNGPQLRTLETAAKKSGVCVRLGYNHRFHPALLKARELVDAG